MEKKLCAPATSDCDPLIAHHLSGEARLSGIEAEPVIGDALQSKKSMRNKNHLYLTLIMELVLRDVKIDVIFTIQTK